MSITFDLYFKKVMLLADTLVVKHSYLARIINDAVKLNSSGRIAVDANRPETWKYYMNLAGEYHQYDRAELLKLSGGTTEYMRIKVAGDYQPVEVDFTRELISGPNADPAIANEYKYGTSHYNALVARYPDFEELILGILNPIPKEMSIAAKDGEILLCGEYQKTRSPLNPKVYYFKRAEESIFTKLELIEKQEDDLIPSLQKFCYAYLNRWLVHDYVKVDDLYFHDVWGIMFAGVATTILNARLAACKTNHAHSYHIRELLNSHGYLGRHIDTLAIEQSLWLYRNVEYLDANMGTQKTFDLLIENVFTPSNIPLRGYSLAHDAKDVALGRLPKLLGYEQPLNFDGAGTTLDRSYTVGELLEKERGLARDNAVVEEDHATYLDFEGARSQGSQYSTKLLESTVIDYGNYLPYQVRDVLMNLWAYGIARGTYRGTVYVTHPRSGERIQFTMLNAFILMVYCINKGNSGLELPTVPKVYVSMIPREDQSPHPDFKPKLTRTEFRSLAPVEDLSELELDKILGNSSFRSIYVSSVDFYDEAYKVWDRLCQDYDYAENCQLINKSCYRDIVARRKYWWGMELDLAHSGMDYVQWFANNNLDIADLTSEELLKLGTDLYMYATGYVENNDRKVKAVQKSCIDLLKHYSSHTIHLATNNSSYSPSMSRDSQLKVDNVQIVSSVQYAIAERPTSDHVSYRSAIKFPIPHIETFSPEHISFDVDLQLTVDVEVGTSLTSAVGIRDVVGIGDVSILSAHVYPL